MTAAVNPYTHRTLDRVANALAKACFAAGRGVNQREWLGAFGVTMDITSGTWKSYVGAMRQTGRIEAAGHAQGRRYRPARTAWSLVAATDPPGVAPVAHMARGSYRPAAGPGAAAARRTCLTCRTPFPSEGAHHRVCDRCKTSEVWRAGFTIYDSVTP